MTRYSFSYIGWQEFGVSVCLIFEIDSCAAQASLKVTRWLNLPLSAHSSRFHPLSAGITSRSIIPN